MIFTETRLRGAFIVDLDRHEDERGFFARMFCQREFAERGLEPAVAQANVGLSRRRGTVHGMHFQFPPVAETKLVRCTRGAACDVIVDLRPESATYLEHIAVELTAENGRSLYIPRRFAHGYQALVDGTETIYLSSEFYAPEAEGGVRHDDPRLGITWPLPVELVSEKDRRWLPLAEAEADIRRRMTTGRDLP